MSRFVRSKQHLVLTDACLVISTVIPFIAFEKEFWMKFSLSDNLYVRIFQVKKLNERVCMKNVCGNIWIDKIR